MTATETATAQAIAPDRVLNAQTSMDAVTLRVGDLELMSSYYTDALALQPLEERARGAEEQDSECPGTGVVDADLSIPHRLEPRAILVVV